MTEMETGRMNFRLGTLAVPETHELLDSTATGIVALCKPDGA